LWLSGIPANIVNHLPRSRRDKRAGCGDAGHRYFSSWRAMTTRWIWLVPS
jgi:hypothetical protein